MKAGIVTLCASLLLLPALANARDQSPSQPGEFHPAMNDVVVEVDIADADIVEPGVSLADGYRTLFINRCVGGITISPGYNDSRSNSSSIIDRTRTFPAYPGSDTQWEEVMSDVREMLLPYGLVITDVDPGAQPHTEILACGDSFRGSNVLGVAPFGCGVVQNAIGYAFAENHNVASTRALAETIVHEAGHTFSLNHLYECADPMTYLNGCGDKFFQDEALDCAGLSSGGQWERQSCSCGGSTQNSHQTLLSAFGPRDVAPPDVVITAPQEKESVDAGFPVRVTASSEAGIALASLFVNGVWISEVESAPWVFNAPKELADGSHTVEVEVTDTLGNTTRKTVTVLLGAPCSCSESEICVDGACFADATTEGGFGTSCAQDADCQTGLCALQDGAGTCTAKCEVEGLGCPTGTECVAAGTESVCWEQAGGESASCNSSGRSGLGAFWLLALGLLLLRRRQVGAVKSAL